MLALDSFELALLPGYLIEFNLKVINEKGSCSRNKKSMRAIFHSFKSNTERAKFRLQYKFQLRIDRDYGCKQHERGDIKN